MSGSDARVEQPSELARPFVPDAAFAGNAETAPAYWFVDNLWVVLIDGRQTGGAYSLMEQLMPKDSGPRVAHIHPIDEWFYVLEGEMTVEVGGRTIVARAGDSLWIPRGNVHEFTVTSEVCRALNAYVPAGFEEVVIGLGKPAQRRELPPPMEPPSEETIDKFFTNYWCSDALNAWALSRIGIGERSLRLREQHVGDDELEPAVAAGSEDLGRRSFGGEHPDVDRRPED